MLSHTVYMVSFGKYSKGGNHIYNKCMRGKEVNSVSLKHDYLGSVNFRLFFYPFIPHLVSQ